MNPFEDRRPVYGQDPYVCMVYGMPILCESKDEERIVLSVLDSLEHPQRMDSVVVWDDAFERQVWAPELHEINGLWYIYYSASNGENCNHRNYVLQSIDPFGPYIKLGALGDDLWGIDLTQFNWWDGKRYAVWSGWLNNEEFPQNLYIGVLEKPWRLLNRVRLAVPEYPWERSVQPILEGPQAWVRSDGKLSLLYSANASWTQEYCTGMMTLEGTNPLNPQHWRKEPEPLLKNAGHGCIIEDRFVYARKLSAFPGWTDREIVSVSAEPFLAQRDPKDNKKGPKSY